MPITDCSNCANGYELGRQDQKLADGKRIHSLECMHEADQAYIAELVALVREGDYACAPATVRRTVEVLCHADNESDGSEDKA